MASVILFQYHFHVGSMGDCKGDGNMTPFNLPEDTADFLRAGNQFEYDPATCEPGLVKLKRLEDLVLEEVWLEADKKDDPNSGNEGYYAIPAVSLTGECEAYDPEFILLWLPRERMFGSWDCDHWILSIFDRARWSDIVADPARYLGAQWDAQSPITAHMKPWRNYEFKPGRPF